MKLKISDMIKQYRCEHQLTQKQLGIQLQISPQAISKWELGISSPDISMFPRLASLLGCSVDDFFEKST